MKRTQQSVLLAALALSLSGCQYIPWRLTSAMPPAANPPVAHGPEAAPASSTVAPNSTSEKSSTSTPPSGQ